MSVKNFVQCSLTTPVAAGSTELILVAPVAPYVLPPADGGVLVIADSVGRPTFVEVIRYTSCSGNVLYGVTRGQEGTTPRAWSGPTFIYQALTANEYMAALAGKESSIVAGTAAQMWLGNKTWASVLSQVQGTLLTGLSLATGTAISAADTVLSGLGKLQKQITDAATNLAGNVRNTAITGYVVGSNTALAATDTVLGALGKIQGQLNGKQASLGYTAENLANKGVANGYAELDATGKVPAIQLPSFVDDVLEFANLASFPATGETGKIYVDLATNKSHRWSGSVYVEISASPGSTDAVTEGSGNLYFTEGRVRATLLAGYAVGANAVLAAGDSVLAAFGKLQAQITGLATSKLDATANAVSASKLQTARTIALGGDLTGSVAFDGSANALLNAALPSRLGKTAQVITDWDLAIENGYYQGSNLLNAPLPGWTIGHVISHGGAGWVTQDVHSFTSDSPQDSKAFRRERNSGTWGPWFRLRTTEAEQSALYNNASNLSSGTIPNARLSGTYSGVNITGNAATATTLTGLTPTVAELNYVAGVTSSIQTQLNAKAPLASPALTGVPTVPTAAVGTNTTQVASTAYTVAEIGSRAPTKAGVGASGTWPISVTGSAASCSGNSASATTLTGLTPTVTELNYVDGVTSAIQTQLNGKAPLTGAGTSGSWPISVTGNAGTATTLGGFAVGGLQEVGRYQDWHASANGFEYDVRLEVGEGASSAAGVLYVYGTGGLVCSGNVSAYSDIRLKTDIEVIPHALDKVLSLRGVTYTRISNGHREVGVIAQEVQKVLPELVMVGTDDESTLAVAYGNMVGLLIEAIKELKAEVDVLKQGAK